jgi:hypothetical protein
MGAQTKRFVEIADILSLRLECKECKSAISMSINGRQINEAPFVRCPVCGLPWLDRGETSYQGLFARLTDALGKIARAETAATAGPGMRIYFEIAPELKPE